MKQIPEKTRITSKNERAIRKRQRMILKKIKTIGLVTTGLVIGFVAGRLIDEDTSIRNTLTPPQEINLQSDEEYLRDTFNEYYDAKEDYKNRDITKEEFIKQGRELQKDALEFLKDEISNSNNLDENNDVYITRKSEGNNGTTDRVKITDDNGNTDVYYVPDEIDGVLNTYSKVDTWDGTGANWSVKDTEKFMKQTDKLYEELANFAEEETDLDLEEITGKSK